MSNPLFTIFQIDPLTQEEFQLFVELFKTLSGIQIKPEKLGLVESRLRKRFLKLKLTPLEYYQQLKKNPEERAQFVTALTTHKTDWFREPIHFRSLENYLNQFLIQKPNTPFYCWSAACSTGEEVYSTAMCLDRTAKKNLDWRILGTDLSAHCIEQARSGVYNRSTVEQQVPMDLLKRYFLQNLSPEHKDSLRFTTEFKDRIKFKEFNLTDSKLPADVAFNVIFLRNVLIYFENEMTVQIIRNLLNYLKTGGLLILGLSETIPHPEKLGLKRLESSVYLK